MKDFIFLFRADYKELGQASPEQMQARTQKWMDWVGSIAAQNKLSSRGNRLNPAGKVVKQGNVVTDGPFTEIKESVLGYIVVKAETIDEAVKLSEGCPIFVSDGTVEVREFDVI
jgi:hypothetical protein